MIKHVLEDGRGLATLPIDPKWVRETASIVGWMKKGNRHTVMPDISRTYGILAEAAVFFTMRQHEINLYMRMQRDSIPEADLRMGAACLHTNRHLAWLNNPQYSNLAEPSYLTRTTDIVYNGWPIDVKAHSGKKPFEDVRNRFYVQVRAAELLFVDKSVRDLIFYFTYVHMSPTRRPLSVTLLGGIKLKHILKASTVAFIEKGTTINGFTYRDDYYRFSLEMLSSWAAGMHVGGASSSLHRSCVIEKGPLFNQMIPTEQPS